MYEYQNVYLYKNLLVLKYCNFFSVEVWRVLEEGKYKEYG